MYSTTEDELNRESEDYFVLESFFSKEFLFEILSLCFIPIPFYDSYIVYDVGGERVVYLLSDFLLSLMFLRIYLLVKTAMSYSAYSGSYAKKLCQSYGFRVNMFFTLKSKLVVNPELTVLQIFFGTVVTHAYIVRILELPYSRTQGSEFDSLFTSVWFSIITLTTIGYGDYSPSTPPGQMFTMLYAFWGALFLSLLVVACSSIFNLS